MRFSLIARLSVGCNPRMDRFEEFLDNVPENK